MIRLLLVLIFVTCIGISAAWVAENPGEVTIHWFDYRIDTSFAFLLLLAVVGALIIGQIYVLIRRLFLFPSAYMQRRTLKHYRSGLSELTHGVAALAASDLASAETHVRKAEKLLGPTPLALLLSAQIARSQGDDGKTQVLLEKMLDHKETEYLAAHTLSENASKQKHFPQALALAERARAASPRQSVPATSVISLLVRMGQWQEALRELDTATHKAQLTRAQARRIRGVILLSQGIKLLDEGDVETALGHARTALKYLPNFVPAICFAARAYHENAQTAKAKRLLLKAWARAPHPQIADTLRIVIAHEPPAKRQKIAAKLDTLMDTSVLWRCTACGHTAAQWEIHCPSCGSFDTLQ